MTDQTPSVTAFDPSDCAFCCVRGTRRQPNGANPGCPIHGATAGAETTPHRVPAPEVIRDATRQAYIDHEGLGTVAGFDAAADAAYAATLTHLYWKLQRHAAGYRDTVGYVRSQERARGGSERDKRQAAMHRAFARGIEAAGEDIADMLGVPEHEIEPETESTP